MDMLTTLCRAGITRPDRRNGLGLGKLLAYVNMKLSLMFCDLAVGATIPVYLEVLGLNIGTQPSPRCLRCMWSFALILSSSLARRRPLAPW